MRLERVPGTCSQETKQVFFEHVNIYDAYALIDILCFVLLLYWIRQQHQRTSRGYFSPENPVVFSVYLWLLIANAIASLYQALVLTYADGLVTSDIWAWVVAGLYGSTYGVYHIVIEGTTCLLLSSGIGKRSMRRSLMFGLLYGFITTALVGYCIHSPDLDIATVLSRNPSEIQLAAFVIWNGSNALMYFVMWVAPQRGRWTRRPAAVYWGRFFFLYRLVALTAAVIVHQGYDFGVCLAHANLAVIFCCLRTWITFRTFVLETCWWHGVPAQLPPLCCKCCYINSEENSGNWCGCGFGFFKWCSYQKRGNVDESDWANSTLSTGNTRGATKSVEGMNKLNILDGVDLTPSAAVAMSAARDELGVPRGESVAGPTAAEAARDAAAVTDEVNNDKWTIVEANTNEKVNITRPPLRQKSSSRSHFGFAVDSVRSRLNIGVSSRNLSSRSAGIRRASAPAGAAQARAPLLDFAKLQVLTSKILGMGSTARVYLGNWCGRPCAVKVLFTVEITAEEVQRTCYEASLLYNLQSPHVVRVYGVAVLPPSLCVVLELCSHGSLTDLIYTPAPPQLQEPVETPGTPKSSSLSGSAHSLMTSHFGKGNSNHSSGRKKSNAVHTAPIPSPLSSPKSLSSLSPRLNSLSDSSSAPGSGSNRTSQHEVVLSLPPDTTSFLFGSFTGGARFLSSTMFAATTAPAFTEMTENGDSRRSLNDLTNMNTTQKRSPSANIRSSTGHKSSTLAAAESARLRNDVVRGGANVPSTSTSPLSGSSADYYGSSFGTKSPSGVSNHSSLHSSAHGSISFVDEESADFWAYRASGDVESGGVSGNNSTHSDNRNERQSQNSAGVLGWMSSSMSSGGARSSRRSGSKKNQSQDVAWQENAVRDQLPQVPPVNGQLPPPPPLPQFLHPLPWEECLELMLGAAEGLAALVRSKPGFSHNDVKSANFLVHDPSTTDSTRAETNWPAQGATDSEGSPSSRCALVVKLADLEFASCGVTPQHLLAASAAVNWTAPEVLSQAAPVSPASDVYSLAMTMYEIVARQIPFAKFPKISERIQAGDRPRFPASQNVLGLSSDDSNKNFKLGDLNNMHRASMAAFLEGEDIGSSTHSHLRDGSESKNEASGGATVAKRKSSAAAVAAKKAAARAETALKALIARGQADEAACEEASRAHIEALIAQAWSQDPLGRPTAAECATAITEELDRYLLSLVEAAQAAASVAFNASAVQPPSLNLSQTSPSTSPVFTPLGGSAPAMLLRPSSELELAQVGEKALPPSPAMTHHASSPQLPSDSELAQQSLLPPPSPPSQSLLPDIAVSAPHLPAGQPLTVPSQSNPASKRSSDPAAFLMDPSAIRTLTAAAKPNDGANEGN